MAKIIVSNPKTGEPYTSFISSDLTTFLNSRPKGELLEISFQETGREPIVIDNYVTLGENVIPNPEPTGLLYSSKTKIDWAALNGQKLTVNDTYGLISANGKGFHMNASGKPRMILDPSDKSLTLEHDGAYGRAYFSVLNYNSSLRLWFMLDKMTHNLSLKTRNRHQVNEEGGQAVTDEHRQGGIGESEHEKTIEMQVEVVHGTNTLDTSFNLPTNLLPNKWYYVEYDVFDVAADTCRQVVRLNQGQGLKEVAKRDIKPPKQFFYKADFNTWSEFWLRLNADDGGWVKFKDVELWGI